MAALSKVLPSRQRSERKTSKLTRYQQKWGLIFISPWVIGFLLFYLLPMVASFGFSLFNFNLATPEDSRFVGFVNWERALVQDPEVLASFVRTFKFAAITLPIGLGFALFLAILLNSPHVFGKTIYRSFFYMPTMVPLVATTLIWSGVLNEQTGWFNLFLEEFFGIKAVGVQGVRWLADPRLIYFTYTLIGLWGVGNAMIIMLAGLQSVPTELYEAAMIDGAGWWRRLRTITLPLISPVLFYNLVLGVIGLMQYFLVPYVLNGGSGFPQGTTRFIMVWFYRQSFTFFNMGYGATLAWLIFAVALALTFLLFGSAKYWVYYAGEEA